MEEEATQCTQNTQGMVDPRRMGRNNSGLSEADIADVMCILHPCSPAAFKIVAYTAERTPQNVLQNNGVHDFDDNLTPSELEEQETFILPSGTSTQAMDLALRFLAPVRNPQLGFVFGRNPNSCDIVLSTDTCKRVSNMHFSIFINDSGVLLLQDMSTNGTIVDDVVLKGKGAGGGVQTRMLNSGSMIQILSPHNEELVKFIVRIPTREGHFAEYQRNFEAHIHNVRMAGARNQDRGLLRRRPTAADPITQKGGSLGGQLMHNTHGMHWSGGDSYNVVGLIGKGAFATVYQLATKSEGQLFAAKELEKRRFMKNGVMDRKLDNEMQIMKATNHENVVKFIDYVDQPRHMYIIMEFVPCGDLSQYLHQHGALAESLSKQMAEQVLDALAYLHKKKITHRDIKPDNILLANLDPSNFTVKLSDFGLSKVVKDNETFLKTFCGTLLYCAPEVFPHYDAHVAGKGKKRPRKSTPQGPSKTYHSYSQTVDIWSFGAVLWYALCVRPPFEGVADNTGRGMFEKIMMTALDVSDLVKQGVSDDAVALLVEMLNTDPATRPSPAQCLRHKWFGFAEQAVEGAEEDGLNPIEEEAEGDEEPDVSGLSLDERDDSHDSQTSEVSIHSGSLEFLDPRKSKRFKPDTQAYRDQDDFIESSPELLYHSIPIMHQPDAIPASAPAQAQTQPSRQKLFGEISQSALGQGNVTTPGVTQGHTTHPDGQQQYDNGHDPDERAGARGNVASPSLLGAESMVRDLNMNSPHSANSSQGADSNGPAEPRTPGNTEFSSPKNGPNEDFTPRPRQQAMFSRQINIPIPASFYFEAEDPSTHTLEYASKISGHDYLANPSYIKQIVNETSLPATMSAGSATDNAATDDENEVAEKPTEHAAPTMSRHIAISQPSEFVKPPPRLGRLTTTPESFTQITVNLSTRMTSWGRDPGNTHPYPDTKDTRIAKRAVLIYFHAKGIEAVPEEDQSWIHMPDLHCLITTQSSLGIHVNGVALKKAEQGKWAYGRVYTGDEITVISPDREGKRGLKFVCEFLHGEGRERRPEDGRGFRQYVTAPPAGASGGNGGKGKEKEKERERVAVGKEAVAAAS